MTESKRTFVDIANEVFSQDDKDRLYAISQGKYKEYAKEKKFSRDKEILVLREIAKGKVLLKEGDMAISPLELIRLCDEILYWRNK